MKKRILPVLLLVAALLGGCGREQAKIRSLEDMRNMTLTVGTQDDIDANGYILEACPDAKIVPQNDALLGVRSVSEGKLDVFVAGRNNLEKAAIDGNIKGVRILDEPLVSYPVALGLSKLCSIPEFESTVNETMNRFISDGIIEEMRQRWFLQGSEEMPEIKLDDAPEYVLNAVTFGESKPFSFLKDGELTGFDVELLYRVCETNHWGLKLSRSNYAGMLMGLSSGKYDMISADLYVTESRADNVLFSFPFRTQDICAVVRDTSVPASGEDEAQKMEYSSLDALDGEKTFAVMTGTVEDMFIKNMYPQAKIEYYQSPVDCALALTNGKADAAAYDAPALKYIAACTPGVVLIPEFLVKDDYHFILPKSEQGEALQKEFNEWFAFQKQNGEADRLYDFWCSNENPDYDLDFAALPETDGKIRIAAAPASRPDIFYFNNRPTGFPIELIYDFCRDKGYGAELIVTNFDSLLTSLTSGKADIGVTFVSYTEERAQSVLYTDCVLESGVGVLVRTVGSAEKASFLDTLKSGLKKTFVTEDRWKLIASGLGVTLLITLGGFLLANLLGVAFCACTMSKSRGLQILADVFDRIMQGTPMVVILMILYYVVFGRSSILGIWVAIFAFGMSSGVSLARQFTGAITGVDKGQTEAALAIGFTKVKAFTGIVFPQAARIALPGYFSEIIALMKGTAIVGYISVIDLTKAGDLIRSSTYDAFFPLLSAAVIYFLISFALLSLLKRIQKKLAPKRVVTQEVEK